MANNFVLNLRALRSEANSKASNMANNIKMPVTRGDIVKANRSVNDKRAEVSDEPQMCLVDDSKKKESPEEIAAKVKETAPIREQIRQVSDGKIMVDQSIYNEESLNRILNVVQKMKQQNNGNLFPAYTAISNVDRPYNYLTSGTFHYNDTYMTGRKNTPYRINIKNANDVESNDLDAFFDLYFNYHPETPENEYGNESSTVAHELSHSAHKNAYKKMVPPKPALTYDDKKTFQNFINTHSSLKQLFHDAAKNTNFDNLVDAAESVSGYAKKYAENAKPTDSFYLAEVFAEAYTDVLYNGENASPYSKELIRLYNDYINDYNKTFAGWDDPKRGLVFNATLENLLNDRNKFIENLRQANLNPKWEKPRDK